MFDSSFELTVLQQLWIDMFRNDSICQFDYASYSIGKSIGYHKEGSRHVLMSEFVCQFPFFWLVKEAFESQWETVSATSGMCLYATRIICWEIE